MNLLKNESSPYLLQHAANPVHWMPWGQEAFDLAKLENKPVLISIGYSSCHWCHVMEHESFEDEETAGLMNQLFINIKVDREEYPDVDHMYMDAVQTMTGQGGWPLNVFVTPEKKPFYGGTYFPPMRKHARPSWKEVLINVSQYFTQNRDEVEKQSQELIAHLKKISFNDRAKSNGNPIAEQEATTLCINMNEKILENADKISGGFGVAPKFPSTFSIKYLLEHYTLYQNEDSLKHALLSLDKMMMGGIYDQIRGGFSRYSTDRDWIAPHFEKMLYDNALFIEVYAIAYSITKNKEYKRVIQETIQWLRIEMMNEEYAFYSALDADSEGVEGKYYTWNYEELKNILQDDFEWFASFYQIEPAGNWEHTNILFCTDKSHSELKEENKIKLSEIHERLLIIRDQRVRPATDDKILLGWNALMNHALVTAYMCLNEPEYLILAEKNMNFMLSEMKSVEFLYFHTYRNKKTKLPAYADDLAYLAQALISIGQACAKTAYLTEAKKIVDHMNQNFKEEENPLYSYTHLNYMQVDVNKADIYDGAIPSSNAVLSKVLHQLYYSFNDSIYHKRSENMMQFMSELFLKYPGSFAVWGAEFQNQHTDLKEVSIVGERAKEFYLTLINKKYRSNVSFLISDKDEGNSIPAVEGKFMDGETLIYICKDSVCHEPLRDINDAFIEL